MQGLTASKDAKAQGEKRLKAPRRNIPDTVVFRPYLHGVLRVMHIFTQLHLHYDVTYLNRQSGTSRTENLLLH